jgi:hypothetical protein
VVSRSDLFGVTVGEKLSVKSLRLRSVRLGKELPLTAEAYRLTPQEPVEVLATYEDGSPAAIARSLGKGRAILFGSNPFSLAAVADQQWRGFFTGW